jgi:hypothetical protein
LGVVPVGSGQVVLKLLMVILYRTHLRSGKSFLYGEHDGQQEGGGQAT